MPVAHSTVTMRMAFKMCIRDSAGMRREITGGLTWRSRALLLLLPMVAVVAALSIGRVGVPVSYIFDSVLDKLGMQAAELMTCLLYTSNRSQVQEFL